MPLSSNQIELISQLENESLVNGRYEKLHCVNPKGGIWRGVLSLVFQAFDTQQHSLVAIKMMDPDLLGEAYRITAFEREPDVLEFLEGKNRCLQLTDGLQKYLWHIKSLNKPDPVEIKCKFFVTEWLEEDVDDYFYDQQNHSASEKLKIFRQLLLAVEAVHRLKIFHRDIKVNNIRVKSTSDQSVLVLIDFGTAAHISHEPLVSNYSGPVGADAFSPPEAFFGLSSDRTLGKLSDSYALGALLFNLFNSEPFFHVRRDKTHFRRVIMSLSPIMNDAKSSTGKRNAWRKHVGRFKALTMPPAIHGPGTTLPLSVSQVIGQAYLELASFDFFHRTSDLSIARNRIDTAIRILDHQRRELVVLQQRRIRRERRQEKIRQKQERLESYTFRRLLKSA